MTNNKHITNDDIFVDDPAITVSPTDTVILAQDGSVTFICEIRGSPNLDLAWYHNHQLVQPGSGHTVSAKYDINETSQGEYCYLISKDVQYPIN